MKRVLGALLLGGALMMAAPTAANAADAGVQHYHHYSCWSHHWGHEHHWEHHFGRWECHRW